MNHLLAVFKLQTMVFTSIPMLARIAKHTNQFFGLPQIGPDRFWRKRATKMMTAHFYGRSRNCYSLAKRYNLKALQQAKANRKLKKEDARDLWDCRVEGVGNTLNYNTWYMRESLARTGVVLDRHMLSNLAITEPRTFRALTAIAAVKTSQGLDEGGLGLHNMGLGPDGVEVVGEL